MFWRTRLLECRVESLREELAVINKALELGSVPLFDTFTTYNSMRLYRLEKKIDLLYEHLGLEYQENCSEQLPKVIKKKKGK